MSELEKKMLELQEQLKKEQTAKAELEEKQKVMAASLDAEKKVSAELKQKEHLRLVEQAKVIRNDVVENMSDEYLRSIMDTAKFFQREQTAPLNTPSLSNAKPIVKSYLDIS